MGVTEGPSQEPEPDSVEADQGGVFGRLPGSRPGTRSPRRDGGRADEPPSSPEDDSEGGGRPIAHSAPPPPAPDRESHPPPAAGPADADEPPPSAKQGGGLEDLAWAGVAAAAEAATIGVRLANRALGALRGSPERD